MNKSKAQLVEEVERLRRRLAQLEREEVERLEAEQTLRESEGRFRSLFETMAEGVILVNADGRIVQANPAAERILGLKAADIEARIYVSPEWEVLRADGTP